VQTQNLQRLEERKGREGMRERPWEWDSISTSEGADLPTSFGFLAGKTGALKRLFTKVAFPSPSSPTKRKCKGNELGEKKG